MGKDSDIPTSPTSAQLPQHGSGETREGSETSQNSPVIRGGPADFFAAQREAFKATLNRADGAGIRSLMAQAFANLESNITRRAAGKPPIACGKGCSTCCHGSRVDATGPEILELASHIRSLPAVERKDLTDRVTATDAMTHGITLTERVRRADPCPLLGNDGNCRVYSARPLACRGHASYDRQACVDVAAGLRRGVPISMPHTQTRHLVQAALEAALLDAGLEPHQYELIHALRCALADPTAEEKWLRGIDVMSDALSTEAQDPEHGVLAVIKRLEKERRNPN